MNHVLIKIRNSLSKISLYKRIKALWLAGRNSFGHIFTFPQGWGLQSSVSSDGKISSHLTVHSHFTAPKPRCPQVRGGISYHCSTWGHFPRQKNRPHRMIHSKGGTNDAKSVTQPSARSHSSTDDATVEKFGKSHKHHWAKAYFMERGDDSASKTLESFNRSCTQVTRNPNLSQDMRVNHRFSEEGGDNSPSENKRKNPSSLPQGYV